MVDFNNTFAVKRWILVVFLIVIITLIVGLIFEIPTTQLAASIIISFILVISAFVFQKLGTRNADKNDETRNN
ncbi:MAG TPA: hypothetical protein VFY50_00210 [Candidatus Nitrosocosmicus sp.]|nr:hypothetical protein [Candidatus Nitrosocosmicus sp.]